jgi:hypothetical protein
LTIAGALWAWVAARHGNGSGHTTRGIFEADLHGILEVLPARRRPRLTLAPLPKQVLKDVAKTAPTLAKIEIAYIEIAEIRPVKSAACSGAGLKGAMTELIIFLPEFGITEDMIGFRDLLETALSLLIPWVQVGMMLASQSTIGFLDIFVLGRALDPKYFVIIAFYS